MLRWEKPHVGLFVAVVELLGGVALLAGLATRPAAAVLAVEMFVAVALFHALVCLVLGGSGAWSLQPIILRGRAAGEGARGAS